MRTVLLSFALASAVCFTAPPNPGKDVIRSTRTVKGQFVAFEWGDYPHAIIKDAKGKETDYFFGADGIDFYLCTRAKKPGVFTIQKVNTYIQEAGGWQIIDRMSNAKIGAQDCKSWWKQESKAHTQEWIFKKYQPLVDKLTRK
jgi:hypothetical protein